MNISTAIEARRSVRSFLPTAVPDSVLKKLVEQGRLYASGGNLQPVRFAIVSKPEMCAQVFRLLHWAMYLPEYQVTDQMQPTAYILLFRDSAISKNCSFDIGAAATTIMLSAKEQGLDTCCIGSFQRAAVSALLSLEDRFVPELVMAVGYSAQSNYTEPYADTPKYHLDEHGNFVVPKYTSQQVLVYTDV